MTSDAWDEGFRAAQEEYSERIQELEFDNEALHQLIAANYRTLRDEILKECLAKTTTPDGVTVPTTTIATEEVDFSVSSANG